jgi:membrane protease YdiL (CAAX protease family)
VRSTREDRQMHPTPRWAPFRQLVLLEVAVATLLLLVAGLWQMWFPLGLWQALRWSYWSLPLGLVAALPPLLLLLVLESSLNWRWLCVFRDNVHAFLAPLLGHLQWSEMLALAGLAGLSEEVFFRGVLQQKMGLLLASLVFGVLHALSFPYMIWATVTGLYLGWLLLVTQTLWVPIVTHTGIDFMGLVYIRLVVVPRADAFRCRDQT